MSYSRKKWVDEMEILAKKDQLVNQAEEHIVIGNLLKKKRTPEKQQTIESILKGNKPLGEKIKRIQEIDNSKEVPDFKKQKTQAPSEMELIRNRRKLKKNMERESFFKYLFKHYHKIKDFGENTHIITTSVMPFTLKINKNVFVYFRNYYQKKYIPPLMHLLNKLLEVGWKYIRKKEYNLLVMLKRLCLAVMGVNFTALDCKDKQLIDRMGQMENLFFQLYYRPEFMDQIIKAAQKIMDEESKFKKEDRDFPVMVKRILLKDITLPSLYNFILGLNMFKNRKYMAMRDLLNYKSGNLVSATSFECDDKVEEKIKTFINDEEKLLGPIFNRLSELKQLKAFLPPENKGNRDFSILEHFYNDKTYNPPLIFSKDTENIVIFATNLTNRFELLFKEFLNGKIFIDKVGMAEVFTSRFFSFEFAKLQNQGEKLEKLSFSMPTFSQSRFNDLKISPRNATTVEVEVMQQINEITTILVDIGKKLSEIVLKRQPTTKGAANNITLDPVILTGKNFGIPYETSTLVSENLLHGRTVVDTISFITCICLLCGIFFKNGYIMDLLKNEARILGVIKEKDSLLKRLADPAVYLKIRQKYKMDSLNLNS